MGEPRTRAGHRVRTRRLRALNAAGRRTTTPGAPAGLRASSRPAPGHDQARGPQAAHGTERGVRLVAGGACAGPRVHSGRGRSGGGDGRRGDATAA